MTRRISTGALLAGVIAMLAFASAATAKGGTGGGGTGGGKACATLNSFSNTLGANAEGPTVTTSYSVFNGCVDETMSAIAIDYRNETTGFVGRSVVMASYGTNDYSSTWNAGYSNRYTITITVYAPNGSIQATQSQTVTTPAAPTT